MDCLGLSIDPYFEMAIHGLSKYKMTNTEGGIRAGNKLPLTASSKTPPEGIKCPPTSGKNTNQLTNS